VSEEAMTYGMEADAKKAFPCFSDFSREILKRDLQAVFKDIAAGTPELGLLKAWTARYMATRKDAGTFKSARNIKHTLTGLELLDGNTLKLSPVGLEIANAETPELARAIFLKYVLQEKEGFSLIEALERLHKREENLRGKAKEIIQCELEDMGYALPNATTYHTTLLNWLVEAGLVGPRSEGFKPKDDKIKKLLGLAASEASEVASLSRVQTLFLRSLRLHVDTDRKPIPSKHIFNDIARNHKGAVDMDQVAKTIIKPLTDAGWLTTTKTFGKSGEVTATQKLLDMPLWAIERSFESHVPATLRGHLDTPLSTIREMLDDSDSSKKGLGLELLALRMVRDLGLEPRGFRERANVGGGEVDLLAEGANLLFSRWTIQCKNFKSANVRHRDVAKEVGMAMHSKAHVVMVVSRSDFTGGARRMARELAETTHLQFVLVPGEIVEAYLNSGFDALSNFMQKNARKTMKLKQMQAEEALNDE
jgi:hypothetical protein